MPSVRMLIAARELAEKEKMKNQGTIKARRSQENDTREVADKTNKSETARALKKAESDKKTARAELDLASAKEKIAGMQQALGAIGTVGNLALGAVKQVRNAQKNEQAKLKESIGEDRNKRNGLREENDKLKKEKATLDPVKDKDKIANIDKKIAVNDKKIAGLTASIAQKEAKLADISSLKGFAKSLFGGSKSEKVDNKDVKAADKKIEGADKKIEGADKAIGKATKDLEKAEKSGDAGKIKEAQGELKKALGDKDTALNEKNNALEEKSKALDGEKEKLTGQLKNVDPESKQGKELKDKLNAVDLEIGKTAEQQDKTGVEKEEVKDQSKALEEGKSSSDIKALAQDTSGSDFQKDIPLGIGEKIKEGFNDVVDGVKDAAKTVASIPGEIADGVSDAASAVSNGVSSAAKGIKDAFKRDPEAVKEGNKKGDNYTLLGFAKDAANGVNLPPGAVDGAALKRIEGRLSANEGKKEGDAGYVKLTNADGSINQDALKTALTDKNINLGQALDKNGNFDKAGIDNLRSEQLKGTQTALFGLVTFNHDKPKGLSEEATGLKTQVEGLDRRIGADSKDLLNKFDENSSNKIDINTPEGKAQKEQLEKLGVKVDKNGNIDRASLADAKRGNLSIQRDNLNAEKTQLNNDKTLLDKFDGNTPNKININTPEGKAQKEQLEKLGVKVDKDGNIDGASLAAAKNNNASAITANSEALKDNAASTAITSAARKDTSEKLADAKGEGGYKIHFIKGALLEKLLNKFKEKTGIDLESTISDARKDFSHDGAKTLKGLNESDRQETLKAFGATDKDFADLNSDNKDVRRTAKENIRKAEDAFSNHLDTSKGAFASKTDKENHSLLSAASKDPSHKFKGDERANLEKLGVKFDEKGRIDQDSLKTQLTSRGFGNVISTDGSINQDAAISSGNKLKIDGISQSDFNKLDSGQQKILASGNAIFNGFKKDASGNEVKNEKGQSIGNIEIKTSFLGKKNVDDISSQIKGDLGAIKSAEQTGKVNLNTPEGQAQKARLEKLGVKIGADGTVDKDSLTKAKNNVVSDFKTLSQTDAAAAGKVFASLNSDDKKTLLENKSSTSANIANGQAILSKPADGLIGENGLVDKNSAAFNKLSEQDKKDVLAAQSANLLNSVTGANGEFDSNKFDALSPDKQDELKKDLGLEDTPISGNEDLIKSRFNNAKNEIGGAKTDISNAELAANIEGLSGDSITDSNGIKNAAAQIEALGGIGEPGGKGEQVLQELAKTNPELAEKIMDQINSGKGSKVSNSTSEFIKDKSAQIGGSKYQVGENPGTLNSILLFLNLANPSIQLYLQALDKKREAEEQKLEAIKKLAAANKFIDTLKKDLKRLEGDGGAGLQAAGAGTGGA
ncbi:MAG: hypothetical protein U0457_03130 [Candidatus Sericytochromatia bacterium]